MRLRYFTFFTTSMLLIAGPSWAVPFGFGCISGNIAADCTIGEAQLAVDVTDAFDGTQVLFTFANSGPEASSITAAYFDDGALLASASLIDADDGVGGDSGVDFSPLASAPNLPAGNGASPPFLATSGLSADSDPPVQPNGVNPGESLGIVFDLQADGTFANVIDSLETGELRIGIHVQGFASGGSESFVNVATPVPEPEAAVLFAVGFLIVGSAVAKRSRQPAQ